MSWESNREDVPEEKNRPRLGMLVFGIVFILMVVGLWAANTRSKTTIHSRAYVKYIIISPGADPVSDDQARQLAFDIRERLLSGEDFGTLAKQYSSDTETGAKGGELGWVGKDRVWLKPDQVLDESWIDFIWNTPVGMLSNVIRTQAGYGIILVTERELSEIDEYERELDERVLRGISDSPGDQ